MSNNIAGVVQNQVRAVRTRAGLSQQELARIAGVTRQTVGALEAGQYAPTAAVALRLARALGCRVEDLFWLEDDLPTVEATPVGAVPVAAVAEIRCAVARVGGEWIAYPLIAEAAFRTEMVPADGMIPAQREPSSATVPVRLLDTAETVSRTAVLAGCAPALSLWARSAERAHPGLRVHWLHANSTAALQALLAGHVHAAGIHMYDAATGESNVAFVQSERARTGVAGPIVLVNLGAGEEGMVLAPGNPKTITGPTDLARADVCLVNREPGAGSRSLLDDLLRAAGIAPTAVSGYASPPANGHAAVAGAVRSGSADVGISTAAVAAAYGLDFIPLRRVRYDMALRRASLDEAPVRQILDALSQRWVRAQLAVAGGYDTSQTGEVVAEVL